jgi:hypothetical protein
LHGYSRELGDDSGIPFAIADLVDFLDDVSVARANQVRLAGVTETVCHPLEFLLFVDDFGAKLLMSG